MATRSERSELKKQLVRAQETAQRLPEYEASVAKHQARLEQLRDQEVDDEKVATLRNWLVSVARQAGCQVRRIDLSPPVRRPWHDDDDPLTPPTKKAKKSKAPFALETRSVNFAATGTNAELRALLKSLDDDRRLKHPYSVELRPEGRNPNQLHLELTLWYFALVHSTGTA